jgi:alginate O-acetyltransferase complex protein AlgI
MAFNSSIFLVWFLPIFFLLYLLLGQRFRNGYLLLVSVLIYAWAEPRFVLVLLTTTCIDFYLVRWMSASKKIPVKKIILLFSICMNVGLLFTFKYFNFFIDNLNGLFHSMGLGNIPLLSLVLPLGISFYTFETITYLVDVYKGVHAPQKKTQNYLLYIFLFPKMIAGPVIRYHEIADQLTDRTATETIDHRLNGFYRFSLGLAKKVLIANQLARYGVDKLFYCDPTTLSGTSAWVGIIGYSMQIYFDFSAYSDMAIGIGKMIGFRLPENFNSPYIATSITEYWQRWHITLGNWMKNYIYIPLGGNRNGALRMYVNLSLVFLITGLWHKGSWSLVLWGAVHGFIMILERLFLIRAFKNIPAFFKIVFTFLLVTLAFVLFRLDDLPKSMNYYKALCFNNNIAFTALRPEFWLPLCIAIVFSFLAVFRIGKQLENYFYGDHTSMKRHVLLTLISMILFILAVSFNTRVGFTPFIYFRF